MVWCLVKHGNKFTFTYPTSPLTVTRWNNLSDVEVYLSLSMEPLNVLEPNPFKLLRSLITIVDPFPFSFNVL
jgi:hypothetical protein